MHIKLGNSQFSLNQQPVVEIGNGSATAIDVTTFLSSVEDRGEHFRQEGLAGKVVLLACENSIDFFISLFALWRCESVVVPSMAKLPVSYEQSIVKNLSVEFRVSEGGTLSGYENQVNSYVTRDDCLVLLTSGSSGRPKGVLHSYSSLLSRIESLRRWIPREDAAKTLCSLPTYFGHGLIANCLFPLLTGNQLFLLRDSTLEEKLSLSDYIKKHDITFMSSTPSLWQIFATAGVKKAADLISLRRVHVASAPLRSENYLQIRSLVGSKARVFNVYGMTELASWTAAKECGDGFKDSQVGKLLEGEVRLESAGEDKQGVGSIQIRSRSLMRGYVESGRLYAPPQAPWLNTGDLGRICKETGEITLIGRSDQVINRGGINIFPEEVEAEFLRCPVIEEVCCFAIPSVVFGEALALAVVLRPGGSLMSVKRWCREKVLPQRRPSKWFVLKALPKSSRGKVLRRDVRKECLS